MHLVSLPTRSDPPEHQDIDTARLRQLVARFMTVVAVVTYRSAGGWRGTTVKAFGCISLKPPLLALTLRRDDPARDLLTGRPFTLNVLAADQEGLARTFAGHPGGAAPTWAGSAHAPRLPQALAHFDCRPWARYEAGERILFLGEVLGFSCRPGTPLGYAANRFAPVPDFAPGLEDLDR